MIPWSQSEDEKYNNTHKVLCAECSKNNIHGIIDCLRGAKQNNITNGQEKNAKASLPAGVSPPRALTQLVIRPRKQSGPTFGSSSEQILDGKPKHAIKR